MKHELRSGRTTARPAPAVDPARTPAPPPIARYALSEVQVLHRASDRAAARLGAAVQRCGDAVRAAAAASQGTALPADARAHYEGALGADLGGVRLHTAGASEQASAALGARAYTLGQDIHFGAGQYRPGTPAGDQLLAHELVHTVQQGHAAEGVGPQTKLAVSRPGDAAEREAERVAAAVTAGAPPGAGAVRERPSVTARAPAVMRDLLAAIPAAERQAMRADTAVVTVPTQRLLASTTNPLPPGYTWQHEGTWAENPQLQNGLRALAAQTFDLYPASMTGSGSGGSGSGGSGSGGSGSGGGGAPAGPVRDRVHHRTIDLSGTGARGPQNERFRFTVHGTAVLIEDLGADAPVAALSQEQAAQYGFTQVGAFFGGLWDQVLAALGRIPDAVLRQAQNLPFQEHSGEGPGGRAAEYTVQTRGQQVTRQINIYRQAAEARPEEFVITLVHEFGHALSYRPQSRATRTPAHHDSPEFRQAAAQDGGLARAITDYGASSWAEYWAEAYAQFVRNPRTLAALRPNVSAYFTALTAQLSRNAPPAAHPGARPQRDFLDGDAVLDDPL